MVVDAGVSGPLWSEAAIDELLSKKTLSETAVRNITLIAELLGKYEEHEYLKIMAACDKALQAYLHYRKASLAIFSPSDLTVDNHGIVFEAELCSQ